jgi:hypothetical protein
LRNVVGEREMCGHAPSFQAIDIAMQRDAGSRLNFTTTTKTIHVPMTGKL